MNIVWDGRNGLGGMGYEGFWGMGGKNKYSVLVAMQAEHFVEFTSDIFCFLWRFLCFVSTLNAYKKIKKSKKKKNLS